jgi:hypothetical protein
MSADTKIIELEGVDPAWLLTPEGRKKTQEIFSRNADRLQLRYGPGDLPPGWVQLQVVHPTDSTGTSQQCNEASSPPTGRVAENS